MWFSWGTGTLELNFGGSTGALELAIMSLGASRTPTIILAVAAITSGASAVLRNKMPLEQRRPNDSWLRERRKYNSLGFHANSNSACPPNSLVPKGPNFVIHGTPVTYTPWKYRPLLSMSSRTKRRVYTVWKDQNIGSMIPSRLLRVTTYKRNEALR